MTLNISNLRYGSKCIQKRSDREKKNSNKVSQKIIGKVLVYRLDNFTTGLHISLYFYDLFNFSVYIPSRFW